mgnify:CR=1 FL=1
MIPAGAGGRNYAKPAITRRGKQKRRTDERAALGKWSAIRVSSQSVLGDADDGGKRRLIAHGQIGQRLAIQLDLGHL